MGTKDLTFQERMNIIVELLKVVYSVLLFLL